MASVTHGHEFEQAPGDGEGQGSLVYFNPRGHKESDMTERLNNSNKSDHKKDAFHRCAVTIECGVTIK